jgi:hypothetical protein
VGTMTSTRLGSSPFISKVFFGPGGAILLTAGGDFTFTSPSTQADLSFIPLWADPAFRVTILDSIAGRRLSYPKFSFESIALEYKDSLSGGAWTTLTTDPQTIGDLWEAVDSSANEQRFYRLHLLP